jgi:type I restriction enzyme S subunit
MMTWRSSTLGNICDEVDGVIQTGPFGSQLHGSDYASAGIPVVMPKDIIEGRIIPETVARVSLEHVERLSRHKLRSGDIVYGRRGDIGRQALIRAEQEGWLCGTGCLRLSLGDSVIDPLFLHYYLSQSDVVSWISNQAVGATMPNLNTGILRSVPVKFPALTTQHRISGILSAYDELIENSQKRINTLESMARALYREWFVRFRYPGHESIALDPSPLDDINLGWEILKLGDMCELQKDPYRDTEHSTLPLLDMAHMPSKTLAPSETGMPNELKTSRILFKKGDTLFGAIRCYLRKVVAVHFPGVTNTSVLVLRPNAECFRTLLAIVASDTNTILWAEKQSTGTKMPVINWGVFQNMPTPIPSRELAQSFETLAGPMLDEIGILSSNIKNLRRTRDLLLPRLLSGQIDVETIAS